MKMTLTDKDKRLLLLLLSLICVSCSYFFVYVGNAKKVETIHTENDTLQAKVDELTTMQAKASEIEAQTAQLQNQITGLLSEFPAAIYTEDAIVILNDIETATDITISAANFTMNEVMNTAATQTTEADDTTDTKEVATTTPLNLYGYQSNITFTFQSTYDGFKNMIDFINNHENRMVIHDVTTSYDNSTGNLSGTMSLTMYSLTGTEKEYTSPFVSGINVGVDNIFGTVEIMSEE